jgi:cyclic pyranopterin phosphate synthase
LPDGYSCDSKPDYLSLDEIQSVVSSFARHGINKIRITGGEPSLRRDLPEIITAIKETPGIEKVALTTNAHQLDRKIQTWADCGLDAINISCDSLDPRMMKAIIGRDNLAEMMAGIDLALKSKIKQVKINTVLLKQYNYKQLDHLIEWVKETPISLRFIELMQTVDNTEYFKQNHVSADEIGQRLENSGWAQILRGKNAGPAKEFCHPEYNGHIGFIAPYSKDFCASCNRLRISAIGKLHLCLFGESGYNLRDLMVKGRETELDQFIQKILQDKPDTHFLHQGISGSTTDLAMLGG